jgi:membrane fusion protein, adhesin transport system
MTSLPAPRTPETDSILHSPIDALETRVRPNLRANVLLWLILAFMIMFVVWASLAKIDRTVRGFGRVVTNQQTQVVSNLEGGIIEEILVKTGQQVVAGETLLRLSSTVSNAEFGSGQAIAAGLSAKIARLEAEVKGTAPIFPIYSDAISQTQIDIERALYRARVAELTGIVQSGDARTLAAQRGLEEANAMIAAGSAAQSAATRELAAIRPLVERGIEPLVSLISAQSNASRTASETIAARASAARAQAGISEARAQASQMIQDWRSRAAGELTTAQSELMARRSTLPALADRVKRTEIIAPVDGKVNRVMVTTRGATVGPGNPLVEIVPSGEALIIETMVLPKDIASVQPGQAAQVSITAYDSSIFGKLTGKVETISPDAVVNPENGESHYVVKVRTTSNALVSKSGKTLPIGPGMIADVSLLGDKRSVLSYIFSPLTKIREDAFTE